MALDRHANSKTKRDEADERNCGEASTENADTPHAKTADGGEPVRNSYEAPKVKSVKDIRRIRELLEELKPDKSSGIKSK
jgi:hypothetical protein